MEISNDVPLELIRLSSIASLSAKEPHATCTTEVTNKIISYYHIDSNNKKTNHLITILPSNYINILVNTELNDKIVIKSYYHDLLSFTSSNNIQSTNRLDIINELTNGSIDLLDNIYLYPLTSSALSYSYISYRKRIIIQPMTTTNIRSFLHNYLKYSNHFINNKSTLLPNILSILRIIYNNKKYYYILTLKSFPNTNTHVYKCILSSNNELSYYWNNIHTSNRFNPNNTSTNINISISNKKYKIVDNKSDNKNSNNKCNFYLSISEPLKEKLINAIKNDLQLLESLSIYKYTFVIVGVERDDVYGTLFSPGNVFGPELDNHKRIPLERRQTLKARHDLPISSTAHPFSMRLANKSESKGYITEDSKAENKVDIKLDDNIDINLLDEETNSEPVIDVTAGGSLLPVPFFFDEEYNIEYYISFIDVPSTFNPTILNRLTINNAKRYARDIQHRLNENVLH